MSRSPIDTKARSVSPQEGRKRATRAERRQSIRHAAYRCISERGYHGTTVDDICEAASLSKGSFYWYFKSKQEVFVNIIETWTSEVQGEMKAQFRAAMVAEVPFKAVVAALEREARRSRHLAPVWLEFMSEATREEYARRVVGDFHRHLRRVITELLELALPDSVSDDEVKALAASALAMFFGLLSQQIADPNSLSFSDTIRGCLAVIERQIDERP